MSGWFRIGKPGEDWLAHVHARGKTSQYCVCVSPRFPEDKAEYGPACGRMVVALCDATGCDAPMCELHRTKDPVLPNTDFCPKHKEIAERREQGVRG
ncbi:MAG: hypothetical protein GC160_02775 [Acidobacteria bacterium]|nr:hypothetical protein [Acidobacteriota bacterium]